MLPNFSYVSPKNLRDAIRHLSADGARIHAGGTDLLGCLRDHVFEAARLVSIGRLDELRGVRETADGGLRIGAMTSIAEVAGHPLIKERYTALAQAAAEVGSPQLRNQGTIGGNICQKPRCWYYRGEFHCLRKGGDKCYAVAGENRYHCILGGDRCYIVHPSDTAPALAVFGASVRTAGPGGGRSIRIEDFHVPPSQDPRRETVLEQGEIVTEIILPPAVETKSSYRKVRERGSWDFALAGVAIAIKFTDDKPLNPRVVLSGAAPVPWRSREAEEVIANSPIDQATARKAAASAMKKAVPLEQNGYKVALFRGLIEEQLLALR